LSITLVHAGTIKPRRRHSDKRGMSEKEDPRGRPDRLHLASGEEIGIRYLLDAGARSMAADLRRLERADWSEEAERFISALRAGHILPEDF
jgi:hypothetical protein